MKVTIYISMHWNKYSKEMEPVVRQSTYLSDGDILIAQQEVEFESWGDTQLRQAVYKALLEKKSKVLADAYVEAEEIQNEANDLLALEDHS